MAIEWFICAAYIVQLCSCSNLLQCEFATENKYLGYFSVSPGSFTSGSYFRSFKTSNSVLCKNLCRKDHDCLSASYNRTKDCSFYNTTLLPVLFDSAYDNVVYFWYRCDWNAWSKVPDDKRCKGMFINYVDMAVSVRFKYMELSVVSELYETACLENCSGDPICKIVNYDNSRRQCRLYQSWPSYYVTKVPTNGTNMHEWTCIPGFVNSLTLNQTADKINPVKCTGTWNITDRSMKVTNGSLLGAYFYTQSYQSCLSECDATLICDEVLFNLNYSLCILPQRRASSNTKYLTDDYFIKFQWICHKNDPQWPEMNDKERRFEAMGLTCKRLVDNSDLYISQDHCGTPSNKFSRCTGSSIRGEWNVTDSCLVNQVFWAFKTENSTLNKTGDKDERITKIFTGLTSFWLLHLKDSIFSDANYLECRRFDSSRLDEVTKESEIVSRSMWYALPTENSQNITVIPPRRIIVDSSEIPFFGCRTVMACTSILRNLQIRYFKGIGPIPYLNDNPYNFMLNEDGEVYAIRGWKAKCAAFPDYPESLCFAFIGSFSRSFPTVEFLEGLKKLINFAVEKNHLDRAYTLSVYGDVTNLEKHKKLALIIKNWYRYRNFTVESCSNLRLTTAVANTVAMVLASVLVLCIYISFFHKGKCSKCSFLHDVHFEMIHPSKKMSGSYRHCSYNTKYYIITERSSFLYPEESSRLIKLINLWFTNEYIESSVSKHVDNNLTNYINRHRDPNESIEVHEGFVSGEDDFSHTIHIIRCFSKKNSTAIFSQSTERHLCVCKRFSINFYSFSSLTFINC